MITKGFTENYDFGSKKEVRRDICNCLDALLVSPVSGCSLAKFARQVFLFLGGLTVTAHELVNTTCRIDKFALTRIKGVRGAGDFNLH